MKSPYIKHISWGHMDIEGLGTGRDFKLYPGGGRCWDWKETNTHHVPGIQPADIQELLDHGVEVVVLSRGILLKLQICSETLELLEKSDVQAHILETKMAVEFYNHLARNNTAVGGLFHSTC
jgi:hypothetical protein